MLFFVLKNKIKTEIWDDAFRVDEPIVVLIVIGHFQELFENYIVLQKFRQNSWIFVPKIKMEMFSNVVFGAKIRIILFVLTYIRLFNFWFLVRKFKYFYF